MYSLEIAVNLFFNCRMIAWWHAGLTTAAFGRRQIERVNWVNALAFSRTHSQHTHKQTHRDRHVSTQRQLLASSLKMRCRHRVRCSCTDG